MFLLDLPSETLHLCLKSLLPDNPIHLALARRTCRKLRDIWNTCLPVGAPMWLMRASNPVWVNDDVVTYTDGALTMKKSDGVISSSQSRSLESLVHLRPLIFTAATYHPHRITIGVRSSESEAFFCLAYNDGLCAMPGTIFRTRYGRIYKGELSEEVYTPEGFVRTYYRLHPYAVVFMSRIANDLSYQDYDLIDFFTRDGKTFVFHFEKAYHRRAPDSYAVLFNPSTQMDVQVRVDIIYPFRDHLFIYKYKKRLYVLDTNDRCSVAWTTPIYNVQSLLVTDSATWITRLLDTVLRLDADCLRRPVVVRHPTSMWQRFVGLIRRVPSFVWW